MECIMFCFISLSYLTSSDGIFKCCAFARRAGPRSAFEIYPVNIYIFRNCHNYFFHSDKMLKYGLNATTIYRTPENILMFLQ